MYDGVDLDPKTRELSKVRIWSAPSKECLDLGVLIKEKGAYQAFLGRIDSEYRETFGSAPLREPQPFALPPRAVPRDALGDYLLAA